MKKEKENFIKLTQKKGISLIVLIVTIIVIIILAAVVILTISKNNPVDNAKEATFKEDVRSFQDDLTLTISKEYTDLQGQRDEKINATGEDVKNYIPSFADKYVGKFVIKNDELVGTEELRGKEKQWTEDLNINILLPEYTNYTKEEIDANEYLYAMGATNPEYVVACFNEDYSEVTITKNGKDSNGIIADYAIWTTASPIAEKKDTLTKVIIKNGVTSLGNGGGARGTFYGCKKLTSVIIPDSVTSIGICAFSGCSSLTNITIPNSVTSIENDAFSGCSSLTNIAIPDSVTRIGPNAFADCSSLTNVTIPNSVTSIGNYVFNGCSSLTNVTIPNSVTSIGNYVFNGCSSLAEIKVDENNKNYSSDNGKLFNKDKTAFIKFPGGEKINSYIIPDSVTSIEESAFKGCSSLTNITIPNSVTNIGGNAFEECRSLTNITIPDSVTSIGGAAFYNCRSLTNITIPNSVTSIRNAAFSDCSSLTNITIPSSVTSIDYWVFGNCTSLKNINYMGTKAEWNNISKNTGWNNDSSIKTITCTDGTITL